MADCWVYSVVSNVGDFMCLEMSTVNIGVLFSSVLFGSIGLCQCNTFCCVNASNSCYLSIMLEYIMFIVHTHRR